MSIAHLLHLDNLSVTLHYFSAVALMAEPCHHPAMTSTYTAIIQQNGDWWIGWIEEVPGVNAQERTKGELLASLKEVLKEALDFNREDARSCAPSGYTEELVIV
jgi:predicted RNase H-like HicB family nuclease